MRISSFASLAILVVSTFCANCSKKTTTLQLRVDAVSESNEPVAEAKILLNDQSIGQTNEAGRFEGRVHLPQETMVTLEVRKQSPAKYYSSHFHSFKTTNEPEKSIAVAATLYSVPKSQRHSFGSVASTSPPTSEKTLTSERTDDVQTPEPDPKATNAVATDSTPAPNDPSHNRPTDEAGIINDREPDIVPKLLPFSTTASPPVKPIRKGGDPGHMISISTLTNRQPLRGVKIYWGDEKNARLVELCESNQRGRCFVASPVKPTAPLTLVAEKDGYRTVTITSRLNSQKSLQLNLDKGRTIDVFAVEKVRHHSRGLAGIEIWAKGQKQGLTDRFGHFSYHVKGPSAEPISLDLRANDHLPEEFTTQVNPDQTEPVVRNFSPAEIPPIRLALLHHARLTSGEDTQGVAGGEVTKTSMPSFLRSTARDIVGLPNVRMVAPSQVSLAMERSGLTRMDVLAHGWKNSELDPLVDGMLVATTDPQQKSLEFNIMGSDGRAIGNGRAPYDQSTSSSAEGALKSALAQATMISLTEGCITGEDSGIYQINLGSENSLIKKDLLLQVIPLNPPDSANTHQGSPVLKVVEVKDQYAFAKITTPGKDPSITLGDRVALVKPALRLPNAKSTGIKVQVYDTLMGSPRPIEGAHVYFGNQWVGDTPQDGTFYLTAEEAARPDLLITLSGYQSARSLPLRTESGDFKLELKPGFISVKVNTKPTGLRVILNNQEQNSGNSPVQTTLLNSGQTVTLAVEPPEGFSPLVRSLTPVRGIIDLTQESTLVLEQDPLVTLKKKLVNGPEDELFKAVESIPSTSPHYAAARHLLGAYYMNQRQDPVEAAAQFGRIHHSKATADGTIPSPYPSSRINEAMAIVMVGDNLRISGERQTALAHYQTADKILAAFDGANPSGLTPRQQMYAAFYRAIAQWRMDQIEPAKGSGDTGINLIRTMQRVQAFREVDDENTLYFVETIDSLMTQVRFSMQQERPKQTL